LAGGCSLLPDPCSLLLCAAEEAGYFFKGALGGGEADALEAALG